LRYFPIPKILKFQSIEITPIHVTLDAPVQITVGAKFDVTWDAPGNKLDSVGIKKPGKKGKRVKLKFVKYNDPDERSVTLVAPKQPGKYELFYHDYSNKAVLATRPIEVVQ
jgi:Ca-activated chloride channel family protein